MTGWLAKNGARLLVALLLLALLAAMVAARSCSATRSARAAAKLATGQAAAAIASGQDAANTIGNRMAADAATDAITRENDDAIRTAHGADAPVDPDAAAAGLRSLCRRAAYRRDPQCLQHADPR
jgi:type II secretory pathway component PulK